MDDAELAKQFGGVPISEDDALAREFGGVPIRRRRAAPVEAPPPPPSTQRTWGEAATDVAASALSGLGGLTQAPGQIVRLIPGLAGVGEALAKPGEMISEAGEGLKSEGLKAREALRNQALTEAEKDGILSQFATAITSTLKDPALITSFISEQVPLLLGPAGAVKVTQLLGRGAVEAAGKGLTGVAAKEAQDLAAQQLGKTATRAAIGTGAAMQGADVSGDAYQAAYQKAIAQGLPEDQARDAALSAARIAGVGAGGASLATAGLLGRVGGSAIERKLAGVPGVTRPLSAAGEATSEALEESAGQLFRNIGIRQVDPNQSLTEGIGTAAGLGALGGAFFGGLLGGKPAEPLAPGQRAGETLAQTANRLSREIGLIDQQLNPPEPEKPFATPQEMVAIASQPDGLKQLTAYQEQLRQMPESPERNQAIKDAGEIYAQAIIDAEARKTPEGKEYPHGKEEALPPAPESPYPSATSLIEMVNQISGSDEQIKGLDEYASAIRNLPSSPARQQHLQEIAALKSQIQAGAKARKFTGKGPAPAIISAKDLNTAGITRSDVLHYRLAGKDLTNADEADFVVRELENALKRPNLTPEKFDAIQGILENIEVILEDVRGSAFYAQRAVTEPSGAGAGVVSGEVGPPAAEGPAKPKRPRVVRPTAYVGPSVSGEEGAPAPVAPEVPEGEPAPYVEGPEPGLSTELERPISDEIARLDKEARKVAAVRKPNLFGALMGRLDLGDVKDIGTSGGQVDKQFRPLVKREGQGTFISEMVNDGALDAFLPYEMRLGAPGFDVQESTEYIKDKLRQRSHISFDTQLLLDKLNMSITDLMPLLEAEDIANETQRALREINAQAQEAADEQRERDQEAAVAPTPEPTGGVEGAEVAKKPTVKKPKKSLREVAKNIPEGKFRELEARAKQPAKEVVKPEPVEAPETTVLKAQKTMKAGQLQGILKRILNQYGLKDVELNLEEGMADEGSYSGMLIKLALDNIDPVRVLRHESVHALKEMGFFTPQQWKVLSDRANNEWIDSYLKNRNIDGLPLEAGQQSRYDAYMDLYKGDAEAVMEEAIADAFAYFSQTKAPPGMLKAILTRLQNLFKAIKQAMNIGGYETAEDVFGAIEKGKLKGVAPVSNAQAKASLKLTTRDQTKVKQFIEKVYSDTPVNPFNPRQHAFVYDDGEALVSFELTPDISRADTVHLAWISAYPGRQGYGSRGLQQLKDMAQEAGVSISLSPWDKGQVSKAKLSKFYKQAGFKPLTKGSPTLIWEPAETKASLRTPLSTKYLMEASDDTARKNIGLNTVKIRGRYNNVRDIAIALNQDTINTYGQMTPRDISSADEKRIANAIADEVEYQLGTSAKTGTGLGWYSTNYPNAVKELSKRFPELKDNAHARSIFSAIVAVTSNGEKVTKNIDNATKLYSKFRDGKPMVAMGNRRATALINNLKAIENLVEKHGENFEQFLLQEVTVKDMNAVLRAQGEKTSSEYLQDTKVPVAAIYFGPKLGAFFANLSGSEGYLTMDLWWTRSMNRMRGLLIPKATDASIRKFRDMTGLTTATRDEVIEQAVELRDKYDEYDYTSELEHLVKRKEPAKSALKEAWLKAAQRRAGAAFDQLYFEHQLEKMANTIAKNEFDMIEEAPFNPSDRALMYRAARDAQQTLKDRGIDLTLADIQAALWYYEKRLYAKLSGVKADDIGYEEAIIAQAASGPARPSVVFAGGAGRGAGPGAEVSGAGRVRGEGAGPERASLRTIQTDTANFKKWSSNAPIVIDPDDYEGGAAVFKAFHGTTHNDITVFDTGRGSKEGALGAGPYLSTSVDDVNANYAGVGPDLTVRIGRAWEEISDAFHDDDFYAGEVLENYFADNDLDIEITDENFEELKNQYDDEAIQHAATKSVKGKSEGLVVPAYVRLLKPFDMRGNQGTRFTIESEYDAEGEPTGEPTGSGMDLIKAIGTVADSYNADATDLQDYIFENQEVTAQEVFDRASKSVGDLYDDNGELISSGQFIQDVAREMGFDGLIQKADDYFGANRVGPFGIKQKGMTGVYEDTLHIMPFSSDQIKSSIGNIGTFGQEVPTEEQAKNLGMTKAQAEKAQAKGDIRLSIRAPKTPEFKTFFGNSKIVNPDGTPKVMYHGTARDITEFRPKQANAIFVTDNPRFAEGFADMSENFMVQEVLKKMPANERDDLNKQAEKLAEEKGTFAGDEIRSLVADQLESRVNIMPVFVRAENPFDYENLDHIEQLKQYEIAKRYTDDSISNYIRRVKLGSWEAIEANNIQKAIQSLGFDGFYVTENGYKNLAVYSPTQIKSAIGNQGTYSLTDPDIRKSIRAPKTPEFKTFFGNSKIVGGRDKGMVSGRDVMSWAGIPENQQSDYWQKITNEERDQLTENYRNRNPEGEARVMYHGTARDITEFRAKQAGAIFLSDNPRFSEDFARLSAQWMAQHAEEFLTPKQLKETIETTKSLMKANGYRDEDIAGLEKNNDFADTIEFQEAVKKFMPSGPNIIPVFVRAENPFDYENPDHIDMLKVYEVSKRRTRDSITKMIEDIPYGRWQDIEDARVQKAIKSLGFDGFYVDEGGQKNLGVYSPMQIKSAIGNEGGYSLLNPDIRKSLRSQTAWTEDRIKSLVNAYGYTLSGREGDAKAYAARITPRAFLNATADDTAEQRIADETKALDPAELARNDEPIYLEIRKEDDGDYQIVNHEGRHRMLALANAGYDRGVPVVLVNRPYGAVENAEPIEEAYLRKQSFGTFAGVTRTGRKGINVQLMVPISWNYRNELRDQFGGEAEVKFSLRTLPTLSQNTTGRIHDTIVPRIRPGLVERMQDAITPRSFSKFRAQFVNRFEVQARNDRAVAEQIRLMGGTEQLADVKAESAALFADLGGGLAAAAYGVHDRRGGIPVYKKQFLVEKDFQQLGIYQTKAAAEAAAKKQGAQVYEIGHTVISNENGEEGLISIFSPLMAYEKPAEGQPDAFSLYQFWADVKRASKYILNPNTGKYEEKLFTQEDIKRAAEIEKAFPEFVEIQAKWRKYNDGLVDFMRDTGVISAEGAAQMKLHGDYFPFYRHIGEDDVQGPKLFSSISGVKAPKVAKGSEAPVTDFFETVVRNTQSAIQAGIKNVAGRRATDQGLRLGSVSKVQGVATGPASYRVLEDGKEVYYEADDLMFVESLKALNQTEIPGLGFVAMPAQILRALVTKDPAFMLANMMRDSVSAWQTSGIKMTPIAATLKQFGSALRGTSPELEALQKAGVVGGYDYSRGVDKSAKELEAEMRKEVGAKTTIEKLTSPITSLWGALEKGSSASDAATRMEVYKRVMEETGNEAEALWQSLEVMNFNRKGRSPVIRILTAAVPFMNARIQGLDVLYRTGFRPFFTKDTTDAERQRYHTFWKRGMMMMGLAAMYWALTHDDDDYKKQEQETRDNYWLIPSLGIKIPIAFEVGFLFKVVPERVMQLAFGSDTGEDFLRSMGRQLHSTFSVGLPQIVNPMVEVATNYSFFTQRPVVGQGLEQVDPKYQVGPGTTRFSAMVGEALNISPMKLDHLMQGYFGTMGMYGLNVIDMIADMNSDSPKAARRLEQMPVLRRFMVDPEARGAITGYYDLKKSVDEAVRTVNYLERSRDFAGMQGYMKDNLRMLATRDYIQDLEKNMKQFREMKNMIRVSNMDAEAKRDAITNIGRMEQQLTANIQTLKKNIK